MRDLKFRAWGKNIKEYLSQNGVDPYIYTLKGISDGFIYDVDAFIIEQYTGLKDKNGKEIYEGDIVGFKWTKRLYVVTYRIYDASFILENDEWEEAIHLSLDKDDFEVFGNIHENPELLEKEK